MKLIRTVLVVSAVLTLSACSSTPKVQHMNMKANALYESLQKKTVNLYRVGYKRPSGSVPKAQPLRTASQHSVRQVPAANGNTMEYVAQQPKTALPIREHVSEKEQHFINQYYAL